MFYHSSIDNRFRVIIPAEMRKKLDLHEGDSLAFVEIVPGQYQVQKYDPQKIRDALLIDPRENYDVGPRKGE
ncbi:AbrB/MazE/SpoVT family DNA-binding domain-containing protein [Bacillus sp. FSL K6-6540]|uniref:AbrB/MazE/SpoVT family DNA-binding domain-containing protein n=1 Tax=Bacillus sp. FSL K6-6540 TaxID=2921512 RepID=UPI0030F964C3